MKRFLSLLLIALVITLNSSAGLAKVYAVTVSNGTSYYVDSVNGNDSNSGNSVVKAWKSLGKVNSTVFKPGDKLLFKAGGCWTGQLMPHGVGLSGEPIILDMYGTGNKPIINGNGISDVVPQYGSHTSTTLLISDLQYWIISNLEITNKANTVDNRNGVHLTSTNKHVYLRNLYVHDVTSSQSGSEGDSGVYTGGITSLAICDDLQIEGCTIKNTDRMGISIRGASTNTIIKNNTIDTVYGDGIMIGSSTNAIVEYNVAIECHQLPTGGYVGMWPAYSTNALFQYNEVYLTQTTVDGQAFDLDYYNSGTTFQYNYSHDNEGGAFEFCNDYNNPVSFAEDNTVRYNISQNDHLFIFQFSTGKSFNNKIYNNTVYIGKGFTPTIFNHAVYSEVYNNIFYNLGSGGYIYDANTCYFDNNCYFGNKTTGEPQETHGVYADPGLINAGSGKIGLNTLAGYKLKANSSCINAGKVIDNNGGKDFFGNPAPYPGTLPDIGASEYQGKGKSPEGLNNEFDSTTMAKGWSFVREDKANWSLNNKPDYLSITTQPGDLSGNINTLKNILTKPATDTNFVISTKFDFKPGESGQNAGLIVYGDDDNYYTVTRDNLSGAAFIARNESSGTFNMLGRKTDTIANTTSYLKIEKSADTYTSYYSGDGITWTQLAQNSGINITNPKIGVIAGTTKTQTKSINADFDYIHYGIYDPNPAPIVDNFDSSYLDGRWNIVKEWPSDWNLTDRPGYLRIKAGTGTLEGILNNNIRNIFLQNSPTEDFSIETVMDFKPMQNGQKAGLIVYQDADNYFSITRQRTADRIPKIFEVTQEINGVTTEVGFNDDVSDKQEVQLKIEKIGTTYSAYVRTDLSTWFLIAQGTNIILAKPMVGVFTTKTSSGVSDINADFNSFTYQPLVKTVEVE